jgi:O-Antigen ligase
MTPEKKITATEIYALVFGLFLGLAIWKFGNPVILDHVIIPPATPVQFLADAWPTHWANWILPPLAFAGAFIAFARKPRWPATRWLWPLPLLWFGWQIFSATRTVDLSLTVATLWQFFGCVACFFIGALVVGSPASRKAFPLLLAGILAAFTFCLVRAVDQRLVEFPQSYQMLLDGERTGWTNVPPQMLLEMKREQVVMTTNGVVVANPIMLAKFAKGRVMGTLVYSNALAGMALLLLPVALTLAFGASKLRPTIRSPVIVLVCFLGGAGFFWTGSKLGWLIALTLGGLYLFRIKWPAKLKVAALVLVTVVGLGVFAIRFHHYFAKGATSVVARFDYWRAAVQITLANPMAGTGPGTFQHPYEQIKSPKAEMARLAHNDYLEQFSDSGIPGGVFYGAWIVLTLATVGRRVWKAGDPVVFAVFAGLLGWFVQGVGEFGLYIPASAWTAFTMLGCALALTGNWFDKKPAAG